MIVSIDALFASDEYSPNIEIDAAGVLGRSQVILGRDTMTERQFLVYGRGALESVVASGEPQALDVLTVELDEQTLELEKLIALVEVVKGHTDYVAVA